MGAGPAGQFVAETRNRLTAGITARAEGRARDQIRLAGLVMATGDPIEATALGTQALDWAGPLHSRRATDDLRRLAEPHASHTEVADLRDRIGTVVAA